MNLRVYPGKLALVVVCYIVASFGLVDADFALGGHVWIVQSFHCFCV